MFILEEKFKNYYGEDYFPYYVGTLAAMITYNYNDLLCNVISLKENEFLAKVVKGIVPLPNIKHSLISDAKIALKHKKVFAYNNNIFIDKKPTLVLDLKDKEFNIDYDFHYIDMIKMEKLKTVICLKLPVFLKTNWIILKKSLLAYKLYSSLILSINEFIHLFAKIYLAEKECFYDNWDNEIDYKELSCKILDYSYDFLTNLKLIMKKLRKIFIFPISLK